jgi:NAD(P)-dependent dehydrogenase (short-subunit alcohol dehydrogenase family)
MLKEKRLVVLGGSRGIGFAVAAQAAREGASVVIVASQSKGVAAAVEQLPEGTIGRALDLRSADAVRRLFEELGDFDHLVYTAGEPLPFGLHLVDLDLVAARSFFELRYWSVLTAVQAARPHLRSGGSIVLTSGTSARRPPAGFAVGASICGAIEALTRSLAMELAPLRVNVVTPGMVDTDLWSGILLPPASRCSATLAPGCRLAASAPPPTSQRPTSRSSEAAIRLVSRWLWMGAASWCNKRSASAVAVGRKQNHSAVRWGRKAKTGARRSADGPTPS